MLLGSSLSIFFLYVIGSPDFHVTGSFAGWENVFAYNKSSVIPLGYYGDKSYYFGYQIQASYIQAMQFCNIIHMTLLTINDEAENNRIHNFLRNGRTESVYWTSGARLLDGRNWFWMSYGIPLDYVNWGKGHPNNKLNQCLGIKSTETGLYWTDISCDAKAYFICERYQPKKLLEYEENKAARWNNLVQSPSISPNIGLLHHSNKTYFFGRNIKTTFIQAIQFCKIINMELVSITSQEQNDRISKYIRDTNAGDDWWSSGSKILDGQNWIWINRGLIIDYTNWASREPNGQEKRCLHLINHPNGRLKWTSELCSSEYKVICESNGDEGSRYDIFNFNRDGSTVQPVQATKKDNILPIYGNNTETHPVVQTSGPKLNSTKPITESPTADYDDESWQTDMRKISPGSISLKHYLGKTYHVETDRKATQKQASVYCFYHKMRLVEVNNAAHGAHLQKVLLDASEKRLYWTAGHRQAGNWVWSISQEIVSYSNWKEPSPTLTHDKNCIQIEEGHTEVIWSNANCEEKLSFICEAEASAEQSGQCPQPVVNVYINTNLMTKEGKEELYRKIETSSNAPVKDEGYQVIFTNNIGFSEAHPNNSSITEIFR